jgi:hypothetical protein
MWSPRHILERRAELRADALNRAIRNLPLDTRQAMLAAADADQLIAGAYTDGHGRTCPMLAAHRRGARTHARGFPRAWDRFTGASRPRPATPRELEVLKALLQESIDGGGPGRRPPAPTPPGQVLSQL